MNSLTTTLAWVRYDGKVQTLPAEGAQVLVCRCKGLRSVGKPLRAKLTRHPWGVSWGKSGYVRTGDTWAYWPDAPGVK